MAVFAFYDAYFFPLVIKEMFIEATGLLAFLCWWASRGVVARPGQPDRSLPNPLARPLFYLCLYCLLSILWTLGKELAFQNWVVLLSLLLFFPPLFDFGKAAHFRAAYRNMALVVATILLALAAFQINGVSLDGLLRVRGGNPRTRLSLTIGHNNGVAPTVLVTSFLALSALAASKVRSMRLAYAAFAVAMWVLILFFFLTRSTMLGLIFGGMTLILLNLWPLLSRRRQAAERALRASAKWALALGLAALVGLVVAGSVMALRGGSIAGEYNPNLARNIVDRLRTFNPQFLMVDTRARLWTLGLVMMKHHPLLGLGFCSAHMNYPYYQAAFYEYHPDFPSRPTLNHTEGSHNDYLQFAIEGGMIGLLLLLWCAGVFLRTALIWLRAERAKSGARRLSESAILVACVALFMDALFSFPAHIAPIAVFLPGLLMLWMGCVYSGKTRRLDPSLPVRLGPKPRLALALALWVLVEIPYGTAKDGVPLLTRAGVWSPLGARLIGHTWHARLHSIRLEFTRQLDALRERVARGIHVPPEEITEVTRNTQAFRERSLRFARLIPYFGEAVFDAADAHYDIYRYYKSTRDHVTGMLAQAGGAPSKAIGEEYAKAPEILVTAEQLYRLTERNYRYHSLHWLLGLAQWDLLTSMPVKPEEVLPRIQSMLKDLETARRIYFMPDRLMFEIETRLTTVGGQRVGDPEETSKLVKLLLDTSEDYLINQYLPLIPQKRVIPGRGALDPRTKEFFRVLFPHLTAKNMRLIIEALPLLDRGKATDVAKLYAEALDTFSKQPVPPVFWRFRLLTPPKDNADFSRLLKMHLTEAMGDPTVSPLMSALFLSDMQRFAPPGTDFGEWRSSVLALDGATTDVVTRVLTRHLLAQDEYSRGDLMGAWRENLLAHSRHSAPFQPYVTGRRPGVVDSALWGITWPFLGN